MASLTFVFVLETIETFEMEKKSCLFLKASTLSSKSLRKEYNEHHGIGQIK